MGTWNVLVSIGLFSATGACESPARYQLTAPLFDRVTIQLPAGRTLTIITTGLTPAATHYTESITFNGRPLTSLELTHADLISGGELHVILSSVPAGLTA